MCRRALDAQEGLHGGPQQWHSTRTLYRFPSLRSHLAVQERGHSKCAPKVQSLRRQRYACEVHDAWRAPAQHGAASRSAVTLKRALALVHNDRISVFVKLIVSERLPREEIPQMLCKAVPVDPFIALGL